MGSPLSLLPGSWRLLRRKDVAVPTDLPSTDTIILVMRRMRGPLVTLIAVITIANFGLAAIPGRDTSGNVYHLSVFDSFYHILITASTIGFSETPYTFTVGQRMWVAATIFACVIAWAFMIGSFLALLQDPGFRRAMALERLRSKVRRIREPFTLLVGYGQAGRMIAASLDAAGRRVVVLDEDPNRIEELLGDQLTWDVPSFSGDPRDPSLLGLAGLANPHCEHVLAMTDKDEMNLSVLMATSLLRPNLPVLIRCSEDKNVTWMEDFSPEAIINPFERYGDHLVLGLQRPVTHQLSTWLVSAPGSEMPELKEGLAQGRWIVISDGHFGKEVAKDLRLAGLQVAECHPEDGDPDVTGVSGLVAGSGSDTINMSIAAHARLQNPDIYLSVRQRSARMGSLVRAFDPDSVFVPTSVVAFETLARLEAPRFWAFIEYVRHQDDAWSQDLLDQLVALMGERTPTAAKITINQAECPAITRWLAGGNQFQLGHLLRHPDSRDEFISVFPTLLVRDGVVEYVPEWDTQLQLGDEIGILSRSLGRGLMHQVLNYDSVVEYVVTGVAVPETWLWRKLQGRITKRQLSSSTRQ